MAVELLDLAVAHVPEVGGRDVELGPRRPDHAGERLERPEEGARIDSSIATAERCCGPRRPRITGIR
jgi:hypothetical protein